MNASLLPALHARCKHLRVKLVIEPLASKSIRFLRSGSNPHLQQNKKACPLGKRFYSGGGGGIRTLAGTCAPLTI
jgi:hypothetical protein